MSNLKQYIEDKNKLIERIDRARTKVKELENFEIDVNDSIAKIDKIITSIRDDKISIVLVGAFSDGKTSVIAGWLNEKASNMKIDSDESSDEITPYRSNSIPDGCQIVDTPGLFGYKTESDENGERVLLSDITKKYISEANLILYVVDAKNPVKDSHKECMKWILKDLNKLSTTIFVINKMDNIADITDEDDYAMHTRIKSENLRSKLTDCGLTPAEVETVKIACISAAPGGKEIEEWNGNRQEYLNRSRLHHLENIINTILKEHRQNLIIKTGCDAIYSEIKKNLGIIRENADDLQNIIIPQKKETLERNIKESERFYKQLMSNRREILEELKILEKRKLSAIRASTIEEFQNVLEDEIGLLPNDEGYRLNNEIKEIFDRYFDEHQKMANNLENTIKSQYTKQNQMIQDLLGKGASVLLKRAGCISQATFKNTIFAGRDLMSKVGIKITFKPWGVTNLANRVIKTLPTLGAGLEIATDAISNIKKHKRNKEFKKNKEELKNSLLKFFKEIYDSLNDTQQYLDDFVPSYKELWTQINKDEADIFKLEKQCADFRIWEKNINESDFTIN